MCAIARTAWPRSSATWSATRPLFGCWRPGLTRSKRRDSAGRGTPVLALAERAGKTERRLSGSCKRASSWWRAPWFLSSQQAVLDIACQTMTMTAGARTTSRIWMRKLAWLSRTTEALRLRLTTAHLAKCAGRAVAAGPGVGSGSRRRRPACSWYCGQLFRGADIQKKCRWSMQGLLEATMVWRLSNTAWRWSRPTLRWHDSKSSQKPAKPLLFRALIMHPWAYALPSAK
mmetsp:Transcript_30640/g.81947  ORF Transcript_30640/g.81947 Transcript_30640/m.81947 type:complete len:230 (-) Transcript_30640:690-1379(-)